MLATTAARWEPAWTCEGPSGRTGKSGRPLGTIGVFRLFGPVARGGSQCPPRASTTARAANATGGSRGAARADREPFPRATAGYSLGLPAQAGTVRLNSRRFQTGPQCVALTRLAADSPPGNPLNTADASAEIKPSAVIKRSVTPCGGGTSVAERPGGRGLPHGAPTPGPFELSTFERLRCRRIEGGSRRSRPGRTGNRRKHSPK